MLKENSIIQTDLFHVYAHYKDNECIHSAIYADSKKEAEKLYRESYNTKDLDIIVVITNEYYLSLPECER